MSTNERWMVIDLDGTLCDDRHREHLTKSGRWDDFHARCVEDQPWPDVRAVVNALGETIDVVAITGRNERYRKVTMDWLLTHGVLIDSLYMRGDDDFRPAVEVKTDLLLNHFHTLERAREMILFILEDRNDVAEAWRNLGFRVWQVSAGG
jgi:uncharacterized HAD superfamily protein